MVNAAAVNTLIIEGGRTPSLTVTTILKSNYAVAALFNSLLLSFSTDVNNMNDGDTFALRLNDSRPSTQNWATRVLLGAKCVAVTFTQSAAGNGCQVDLGFIGTSFQGIDTGFPAYVSAAGYMLDKSQVDFGPNLTLANMRSPSFRLGVIRAGSYQFYFNSTLYADHVASGMIGGQFEIDQSPDYLATMGTGLVNPAYVRWGPVGGSPLLTATFACNFNRPLYPLSAGLGQINFAYDFVNPSGVSGTLGANQVVLFS